MTRFLPLLSLLALLHVAPVEAASIPALVDAAFADYAALPSQLVPVLAEARDRESADAVAPKLMAVLPAVYDARSALHDIPALGKEETQLVQQKYEKELREQWGKLFEQIYRLQKVRCYGSLSLLKQFSTLCLMLEK